MRGGETKLDIRDETKECRNRQIKKREKKENGDQRRNVETDRIIKKWVMTNEIRRKEMEEKDERRNEEKDK